MEIKEIIWENIKKVRLNAPLVHNITNYVVMNITANALLAIGASPIMAHAEEEVEDLVKIANSLVINIGTLSKNWVNAMNLALKQAQILNKPCVFDPVGVGATPYRTKVANEFLKFSAIDVIRGNASEIIALTNSSSKNKGVDSIDNTENAIKYGQILNINYKSIVSISGATDYVISSNKIAKIKNGHPIMTKVTGMGCTATALIGAFIAIDENKFNAVCSAMALMGIAGELAEKKSEGPGSFQFFFMDKLYNLKKEEYLETLKIEIENV